MIGLNGGLVGRPRSLYANTGIWTPNEQRLSKNDPYWDSVSLLLHMNGANASTTFTDSSRNANSITSRGDRSAIVAGETNSITQYNCFIGAGSNNSAGGQHCVVVGGSGNSTGGQAGNLAFSFIGGGSSNQANSTYLGVIGGGNGNNITNSSFSAILGGRQNTAQGWFNFIGGGQSNTGTSASAVTTQSTTTTNASTAATLSGANANIRVGQLITGTGIADYTYVADIS